jgi:hypothetical protein
MTLPSLPRLAPLLRRWPVALALALLVACGGGVGTGGTGASASGPITGFGSIIVADIEFDDTDATVLDDTGAPVQRDGNELRLGMTVHVEGTFSAPGTGVARTIRISAAAVGSTESVDPGTGSLGVLGQRVRVNPATVFDATLPNGLASLRPGDKVVVYGLPDPAGGGHVATRIEVAAAAVEQRVEGVVNDLDLAARTFRIGQAVFSYAQAEPPPGLANGHEIGVRASGAGPGPFVVIAFDPQEEPPAEDTRAEIEGVVATITANRRFVVDGQDIDAGQSRFDPNPAALAEGVRVEVEGRITGGVLVAERVRIFEPDAINTRSYRLEGPITDFDLGAKTMVVRNMPVDFATAQFVGGSADDLRRGVKVRVDGPLAPDGTRVRAARIEFRQ